MDCFKFLNRKQEEGETLRQFWNELGGLAAKCNFGGITESLLKDVFIVNTTNKEVQQKLCTKPKATTEKRENNNIHDSIRRRHHQTAIVRQDGEAQP